MSPVQNHFAASPAGLGRQACAACLASISCRRLLALLLVFVCMAAAAQQSGRISGRVVDAHSGQVLAHCVVEIAPTTALGRSASMETGGDGQFVFDGLAVGKYALSASRRGYLTQSYQQHEGFFTGIAVGPGLPSESLVFALTPQAIFFGTVTDQTGEPVRRAQVKLFADGDREGVRSTRQLNGASTDDRGMYEIAGVAPGNYFLAATAQPWYARGRNAASVRGPQADGQGNESAAEFDVAYPTTYYANATDSDEATPIPVKGGERIQANLTLVAQHAMRLHMTVPAGEQTHYSVSLAQPVFGHMEPIATGAQMYENGQIEVDGLLPGHYEVTLTNYTANRQQATHFTADVANDSTQLNAEEATEESSVSGKVISLDARVPSGNIALLSTHARRSYDGAINQAGEFSIRLPAGTYEVVGQIPQMYLADVSSPNAAIKGRMLEVKAGASPKLQIITANGWGDIEGLAESGGHAASGVMVVLAPEDAKDNRVLFRRDQSDSDGTFSLARVVPGRYRLLAIQDGWDLAWADSNVLARFLPGSIPLVVKANGKIKQTIEVQPR